jgi:hypothetical protein
VADQGQERAACSAAPRCIPAPHTIADHRRYWGAT